MSRLRLSFFHHISIALKILTFVSFGLIWCSNNALQSIPISLKRWRSMRKWIPQIHNMDTDEVIKSLMKKLVDEYEEISEVQNLVRKLLVFDIYRMI